MSEAEILLLQTATQDSIFLIAGWLNSQSLWTLILIFLGALISVSLIVIVISKPLAMMGFNSRD